MEPHPMIAQLPEMSKDAPRLADATVGEARAGMELRVEAPKAQAPQTVATQGSLHRFLSMAGLVPLATRTLERAGRRAASVKAAA